MFAAIFLQCGTITQARHQQFQRESGVAYDGAGRDTQLGRE
jgi:hypothetical protein